ncbi:hypothetical protein [Candidatus Solirubrobacter pratensis]|uniref:hypothetical protein n=1 Tax=Candidatus Solirubrobacter pratensis TaxID=1298857 RepID=UPI0012DE0DD7|nr:hypothetical protein [Candidatus Solirubrobacter pratensis]
MRSRLEASALGALRGDIPYALKAAFGRGRLRAGSLRSPVLAGQRRGDAQPGGLRSRAICVAHELGDDVARSLAARLGDPLKPDDVFALDADQQPQLRVRIAGVRLDQTRIDLGEIGIELAGLRVGAVQGSLLIVQPRSRLRSPAVAFQPVTTSHVVGSDVCSITSVSTRRRSRR